MLEYFRPCISRFTKEDINLTKTATLLYSVTTKQFIFDVILTVHRR